MEAETVKIEKKEQPKTPISTGLLEKFLSVYPELSKTKAEPECMISATNDVEAIQCWLYAYRDRSEHTVAAYRKEAVRYLLWLVHIRHESLGATNQDSVEQYNAFLINPPVLWCGSRKSINDPNWRPFQKGLSYKSRTDAVAAIKSMYTWLCDAGYLQRNPMKLLKGKQQDDVAMRNQHTRARQRVLFDDDWELVINAINAFPTSTKTEAAAFERAKFIMNFLYYIGPRSSEILKSNMSSFIKIEGDWYWETEGKGGALRKVPVNRKMLKALRLYRVSLGLDPEVAPTDTTPLLYSLYGENVPITTRKSVYEVVKGIFKKAAELTDNDVTRRKLLAASTHWIRHTFATRANKVGISLSSRKMALGHANDATTSIYTHTKDKVFHEEFEKL